MRLGRGAAAWKADNRWPRAVAATPSEVTVDFVPGENTFEWNRNDPNPDFHSVTAVGGSFGTGSWPDHANLTDRERERNGTHEPVWVPLEELPALDVRPRALGALLTP